MGERAVGLIEQIEINTAKNCPLTHCDRLSLHCRTIEKPSIGWKNVIILDGNQLREIFAWKLMEKCLQNFRFKTHEIGISASS